MYRILRTDLETGEQIWFRTEYPTLEEIHNATRIISGGSYIGGDVQVEHAIYDPSGNLVARYQKGMLVVDITPLAPVTFKDGDVCEHDGGSV